MNFDPASEGITPPKNSSGMNSAKAQYGKLLTPEQHLLLISEDDWEEFIREWAQFQKTKYHLVDRLGGANDHGIDVAGFTSDKGFHGAWDNYQCKYYKGRPITPGIAIPEIGKILWHSFKKTITLPRRYYFFAPRDCGPSLKQLLLDSPKLKKHLVDKWDEWCAATITKKEKIALTGEFADFVEKTDFSIFQYKPRHEVIEDHRSTPYHSYRFGGGLPERPGVDPPPKEPLATESRYIAQLYEAYTDKENAEIRGDKLSSFPKLAAHFGRQREAFFHAESLKKFARDSVPEGTFESLQREIELGVVDTCEDEHIHGFARMRAVLDRASDLPISENGLIQVTKIPDRQGICHHLANEDVLVWVPSHD